MTVLVDSDIFIGVSRGRNTEIVSKWKQLSEHDALIHFSPVTAAELRAGARPSEHEAVEGLFQSLVCAPTDASVGIKAGEYLRRYRKSHAVELGGALIVATRSVTTPT